MVAQFSLRLPGGRDAPAEARRYLRRLHGDVDPELLQVVTLLVSELVTNSVRHAGADEGSLIVLEGEVRPTAVRVDVEDHGPGFSPRILEPVPARGHGFGLFLVEELADRWGVEPTNRGTRVWFEIER